MGGIDEVYVVCAHWLKPQKSVCKFLFGKLKAFALSGYFVVLAETAFQTAAWEKYCSWAFCAADTRFFPHMKLGSGYPYFGSFTAEAFMLVSVHFALSWAEGTAFKDIVHAAVSTPPILV